MISTRILLKLFTVNEVIFHLENFNVPRAEDKEMKELIEYIAKSLVDHPDLVKVTEVEGERTSVIELSVAKEELGKIIGKQGKTARAMRTILSAASTKKRKRTILEIIE